MWGVGKEILKRKLRCRPWPAVWTVMPFAKRWDTGGLGLLEGGWREDGGCMYAFEVVVTSRPMYLTLRWINGYESQVGSGGHLCMNGVGAAGADRLLQ